MPKPKGLYCEQLLLPSGWARYDHCLRYGWRDCRYPLDRKSGDDFQKRCRPVLPGMPNLHSHAFQRAIAGLTERTGPGGDDFWTWRQAVYRFVSQLTPADVEAIAAQLYVDMLKGGYTAVGEFHYLHHDADGMPYDDPAEMSHRVAAAAEDRRHRTDTTPVLYAQGGFGGVPTESGQRRCVCNSDQFARIVDGAERASEAGGAISCRHRAALAAGRWSGSAGLCDPGY